MNIPKSLGAAARLFASLKLTVGLVLLLAVLALVARALGASKGREWAQWYIYSTS